MPRQVVKVLISTAAIFLLNLCIGLPSVSAQEPCADLVITDFSISPSSVVANQNATVLVKVKNQGTCESLSFVVQWKSSRFATAGPSIHIDGLLADDETEVEFDFSFPDAGDFTTIATVDSDNTVDELNENNNLEILNVSVQENKPDLAITGIEIVPVTLAPDFPNLPVAGLNAAITITVLNQGSSASGSFVVQWKSAQSAPNGPSQNVVDLAPGATTDVSFEYAFPNAGNFLTIVNIDTERNVDELNEDNNQEVKSITVQEAVVDLIITELVIEPAPEILASDPPRPVQNRLTATKVVVYNAGNFPAGNFITQWKPTPFSTALTNQVNGLDPGESINVRYEFTFAVAGDFQSTAVVDSTARVRESNEDNNQVVHPITVEPELPDIKIVSVRFFPTLPIQGTSTRVEIQVRNRGNTPAGPFVVQWKPAPLARQFSKQVNSLDVGEMVNVNFAHTFAVAANLLSTVIVDSTRRVRELDEGNNQLQQEVQVQKAERDLVISSVDILTEPEQACEEEGELNAAALVESMVEQNSPFRVCIIVQNLGNSPLGPFVVSWDPDPLGLIFPSQGKLTQQIDMLDAGQSQALELEYVYPESGNFGSIAKVDEFDTIQETNEVNNLVIANLIVEEAGPDLVITDVVIEPDEEGPAIEEPRLVQGKKATVAITVENQGDRTADSFLIEWNPDALGLITPSPGTVSNQIDALDAGESTTLIFEYIYHAFGGFRSVAKVDSLNTLAELNEENNLFVENVVVDPAPVDLRITSFVINNGERPIRGSKVEAEITVFNDGDYPVSNFQVQWKLNGENGTGPRVRVEGLQPFESKIIPIEGTFFTAGPFDSLAIVDVRDQIIETNEDNNRFIRPVNVQPRETTLNVSFDEIRVVEAFSGEWKTLFGILNPDATCNLNDPIEGIECALFPAGLNADTVGVGDGGTFSPNVDFNITLVESAPLVLFGAGADIDISTFLGIPTGVDVTFAGIVLQLWGPQDYRGVGTAVTKSIEGPCNNGECYSLEYTVTILDEPPVFNAAAAESSAAAVTLPEDLARRLPIDTALPDGIIMPDVEHLSPPEPVNENMIDEDSIPDASDSGETVVGETVTSETSPAEEEQLDYLLYLPIINE